MLSLRDLEKRVYHDKECVEFTYCLVDNLTDNKKASLFKADFTKVIDESKSEVNQWNMQIVLSPLVAIAESQVYNVTYVMPKQGKVPLELIAATGLTYFQIHLKEEIQKKTIIDFTLGEVLKGM